MFDVDELLSAEYHVRVLRHRCPVDRHQDVANLQLAGGATALADVVNEASISVPGQDAAEAAAPEGRINQLIETKSGLW